MEFFLGVAVAAAAVYFGGGYLGYWNAPYVNPKD